MTISLSEFALAEFAVFEFAYEQGSVQRNAVANFEGSSSTEFGGVVTSNSSFFIKGTLTPNIFRASMLKPTVASLGKGEGEVNFFGASMRSGAFQASSGSDVFFTSGYVSESKLGISSVSQFNAYFIEPETMDIKGRSVVTFFSGFKQLTSVKASGSTQLGLKSQNFSNSGIKVANTATVVIHAQSKAQSFLGVTASNSISLKAQSKFNARLIATSGTSTVIKAQAVNSRVLRSNGVAKGSFLGNATSVGSLDVKGIGYNNYWSQSVIGFRLVSTGTSSVNIRPGSPVFTSLPLAWDVVIRPYELREVVWK